MQDTVIIIPCYNEEFRLPLDEIRQDLSQNPNVLFIFVNDGSKDNTIRVLEKLEQQYENVVALDKQPNEGKAKAVQYAFNYASKNYHYEYIGYFDADLATPLFEIKRFISIFESQPKLKLVMGSRFMRLGANIERNWKRHFIGRVFATLASITLILPVYDTQCGAKIFKKEIADSIFTEDFISKWLFDVELIARMSLQVGVPEIKDTVYEHPLECWLEKGDSRINGKDFIRFPLDLWKIYRKYHKKIKKLHK
jgi:dolichyl-phosphate beta-glucosyltransferase